MNGFSFSRWLGILIKEFIQIKRDRLTFGMIVGIPIIQLLLFGFAINSDPKHLPTAVVMGDPGPFARAYVAAMENSEPAVPKSQEAPLVLTPSTAGGKLVALFVMALRA